MNLIVAVLLYASFTGKLDGTDASCPDNETSIDVPTVRLRRKLFCDYDTSDRPVKSHTNTTDVRVLLFLRFFMFQESENTLEVHSWFVTTWKDEHLTWDKSEYLELASIKVYSSDIWVPDLTEYNKGSNMGYSVPGTPGMSETHCHLDSDGTVVCVSPTVHSAQCNANLRRWPFDTHNCSLRIGSFYHTADQLNLSLWNSGLLQTEFEPNRDWDLISTKVYPHRFEAEYDDENITLPWMSYSFELKRHSGGHAATVLIPSIVMASLTLAIFLMEARATERICFICLNVLCHCLYLQYLGTKLPSNGDEYPIILLFFRDSLLLVGVSLFVTLMVRNMEVASSAPPDWITTVTDAVLATMPGRIFMTGVDNKGGAGDDDGVGLLETACKDQRWHFFAVLLDRTFFVVIFLTFVILLCAFVP